MSLDEESYQKALEETSGYKKPVTDKDEIIKEIEKYFKNNKWIDVNSFIWNDMNYSDAPTSFILDVASRMEHTGKYVLSVQDGTKYWILKPTPKKSFPERNWLLMVVISSILSPLVVALLLLYIFPKPQNTPLTTVAKSEVGKMISDSLKNKK